ncbi:MAG: hypothetical protein SFW67_21110 [Myxococcaceae bacterium]|nr:hypothetical protein [Myxococcaceae bacterium]
MTTTPAAPPRVAGVTLTVAAFGFIAVFTYLASAFGYPDVLDRPAAEVLPALLEGGASLRLGWVVYAVLPLALSLAAALVSFERQSWVFRAFGVAAGLSMSAGLVRWSTLQWSLAKQWALADGPTRDALSARFGSLNLVLGNVVGEFLGEVFLALWLVAIARSLAGRWVGRASWVLAGLMLVGSLRNVTPLVQLATDVTNGLLPVVLIWVGLTWALRGWPMGRRGESPPMAARGG